MKLFTILLSAVLCAALQAQSVPSGMTYQGRLTDASSTPVPDGTGYEIEVRLWSAATSGTLLWGSRYTGVPLKGGAFNLILGSGGTPIPGATTTDIKAAFNTPTVHLGLTTTKNATGAAISPATEILPRQQIFSTPYAFRAETAASVQPDGVLSAAIKDGEVKAADIAPSSINSVQLADGAVTSVKLSSGAVIPSVIASPGIPANKLDLEFAKFVDEKPTNTNGGTWAQGWTKRVLNKTEVSQGASISRTGDAITLQPGVYWISAQVPIYHNDHIAFLRKPDGTNMMRGTYAYAPFSGFEFSSLQGPLIITDVNTVLELWSYVPNRVTGSDKTFGVPANITAIPNVIPAVPEQYTEISFLKIK